VQVSIQASSPALSWLEALEAGNEEIPPSLAAALETLAQAREASPPPTAYCVKISE
jgi:hypothetical protein